MKTKSKYWSQKSLATSLEIVKFSQMAPLNSALFWESVVLQLNRGLLEGAIIRRLRFVRVLEGNVPNRWIFTKMETEYKCSMLWLDLYHVRLLRGTVIKVGVIVVVGTVKIGVIGVKGWSIVGATFVCLFPSSLFHVLPVKVEIWVVFEWHPILKNICMKNLSSSFFKFP